MRYTTVERIHFSATGTTKTIVEHLSQEFSAEKKDYDLFTKALEHDVHLPATSLAIVGMPVYAGRIPALCVSSLAHLKGQNTPAIVVVAYGNREYDDALLELKNSMEANGFVVIGAAAFIAQHSIFPKVAAGRPDSADLACIADFGRQCTQKLNALPSLEGIVPLQVKGNIPYKEAAAVALKPEADESCTLCGACVEICPVQALKIATHLEKDSTRCIACAACIAACPEQAQAFRGAQYETFSSMFTAKNAQRKEPEIFI